MFGVAIINNIDMQNKYTASRNQSKQIAIPLPIDLPN